MNTALLSDLALAPVACYARTRLMEPVSVKLYQLERQADREREDAVRPGAPYALAADKAAELMGGPCRTRTRTGWRWPSTTG